MSHLTLGLGHVLADILVLVLTPLDKDGAALLPVLLLPHNWLKGRYVNTKFLCTSRFCYKHRKWSGR